MGVPAELFACDVVGAERFIAVSVSQAKE
jgi:hypothetical protein